MKNYWIQALLFKSNEDYCYDDSTKYKPWLICACAVKQMSGRTPRYLRLTISTKLLENGTPWKLVDSCFGRIVENLKTGSRRLIFNEMEDWLRTLDSDTFWVTAEAVDAATYLKGL